MVDVTNTADMPVVKVFEPIKIEDGDIAVADGQAIDVEVIGNRAYLAYDSFGVVAYDMADLIAPLPAGVNPTDLFRKALDGTVIYDYRPAAVGRAGARAARPRLRPARRRLRRVARAAGRLPAAGGALRPDRGLGHRLGEDARLARPARGALA